MTRRVAPSGRQVDVWWADVRGITLTEDDLAILSEAEQARSARLVFAADRYRYQAAHVWLRRVLAGYLGLEPAELRFGQDPCPRCGGPTGRPVLLPHTPAAPGTAAPGVVAPGGGAASPAAGDDRPTQVGGSPPVFFSLAHSGVAVVVAVAGQPVGVDAEQDPAGCICSLANSMHPADAAVVAPLPEPERHQAIISWWVRAEAALKCAGAGIAHGLGEFPVLDATATGGDAGPEGCALAALDAPPGYQAALALAGPGGPPQPRLAGPPPSPRDRRPGTLGG
jgi:4'-phosphopantetheinyl transferase